MRDTREKDILRLNYILDAINRIQTVLSGMTYEEFEFNKDKGELVLFHFIILGEDANKLSKLLQFEHPELPYREMIGTRNRIAHEYHTVDYEVIWDIYQTKLSPLKEQIEKILKEEVKT